MIGATSEGMKRWLGFALLSVLVLAGCSGSDGSSASASVCGLVEEYGDLVGGDSRNELGGEDWLSLEADLDADPDMAQEERDALVEEFRVSPGGEDWIEQFEADFERMQTIVEDLDGRLPDEVDAAIRTNLGYMQSSLAYFAPERYDAVVERSQVTDEAREDEALWYFERVECRVFRDLDTSRTQPED